MSCITIECRLAASSETRQVLWALMAERNTPLVNALLEQLGQHSEFETWRRKGKIASTVVSQLCQTLKADDRFSGQPARLYVSAEHTADYIFKSWLAIQKQLQQRLDGKTRWLDMLKSDEELVQVSGVELTSLRDRAAALLAQLQLSTSPDKTTQNPGKKTKKKTALADRSVANQLFDRYKDAKSILERCAIAFLLKNGCKVPQQDEDP